MHPLNEERTQKGEFYTHYTDHRLFDDRFFELYHMTVGQFDEILYKVGPAIVKKVLANIHVRVFYVSIVEGLEY